jgi:hypothetical protein
MLRTNYLEYILCGMALVFAACEDMNEVNSEYSNRAEAIYTGIVDSIEFAPGFNKVWFRWFLNSDPRITKTVIYWNDNNDSTVVAVNRAVNQPSYHEATFECAEGSFVFKFVTKDDYGNRSVVASSSEASVTVYGERYKQGLHTRGLSSATASGGIIWYNSETHSVYTTVTYRNTDGAQVSLRVENDEMNTALPGTAVGTQLTIVTTFLPEGGLDEVDSPSRTLIL